MYERARTAWHVGFALLVTKRSPSNIAVHIEEPLSLHPRRIDQLLLRRTRGRGRPRPATVLRGLWQYLGNVTLLDFKGPTRGFRPGDLATLSSYGDQYFANHISELITPKNLSLVLVVPTMSLSLNREIEQFELVMTSLGNGYARLTGRLYNIIVVLLDEVSDAERDDYLRVFTKAEEVASVQALRWMRSWVHKGVSMSKLQNLDGFDEVVTKVIRSMDREGLQRFLAGLKPEQRLAGLSPEELRAALSVEERLEGLGVEERLHGLGIEELQAALDKKLNGSH